MAKDASLRSRKKSFSITQKPHGITDCATCWSLAGCASFLARPHHESRHHCAAYFCLRDLLFPSGNFRDCSVFSSHIFSLAIFRFQQHFLLSCLYLICYLEDWSIFTWRLIEASCLILSLSTFSCCFKFLCDSCFSFLQLIWWCVANLPT